MYLRPNRFSTALWATLLQTIIIPVENATKWYPTWFWGANSSFSTQKSELSSEKIRRSHDFPAQNSPVAFYHTDQNIQSSYDNLQWPMSPTCASLFSISYHWLLTHSTSTPPRLVLSQATTGTTLGLCICYSICLEYSFTWSLWLDCASNLGLCPPGPSSIKTWPSILFKIVHSCSALFNSAYHKGIFCYELSIMWYWTIPMKMVPESLSN